MSTKYDGANSLTKLIQLIKAKLATKSDTGHTHAASDVTSGTLPISHGGTGASNAAGALSSLGAAPASHTHDYSDVDTADGEQWYPTFIRSSWSTASDESTLPVTPCFVLSTSDMGLYWCSGSGITRLNHYFGSDWTALQATDGQTLYRLQIQGNGNTRVYKSADGGVTWSVENTLNLDFVKKSGDTMTGKLTFDGGGIAFKGDQATYDMIRFLENAANPYGHGISIGGGGLTVIGGGESAANVASSGIAAEAEQMIVANDNNVEIWTNCQNGAGSAVKFIFGADGRLTMPETVGEIYWKERGYGDQFAIVPVFGGTDDSNRLHIRGAVGGAGTTPALKDLVTIWGKSGTIWGQGSIGCAGDMHVLSITGDSAVAPSSQIGKTIAGAQDKNYIFYSQIRGQLFTDGRKTTEVVARCGSGSAFKQNILGLYINNSGTCTYSVSNAANFRSAIGAAASSDRRLKHGLTPLGDEAEKFIRDLDPSVYTIHGEREVGLVAQDVKEADPWGTSMAFETEAGLDGLDDWEKMPDGTPTWKLRYERIVPPLVKTLQIALDRIDALEKRVAELETGGQS